MSNYDTEPLLRSCGISISSNFTQVEGRVLQAPKVCVQLLGWLFKIVLLHIVNILCVFYDWQLKMGRGDELFPRNGRWNFNNKVLFLLSAILCICFHVKMI